MNRKENAPRPESGGNKKSTNKYTSDSKKSSGIFLNAKISIEFFHKLVQHPVFEKCKNAIKPAYDFLNCVLNKQIMNDNRPVSYFNKNVHNKFKPYITTYSNYPNNTIHYEYDFVNNSGYKSFLDALVELTRITTGISWSSPTATSPRLTVWMKGSCSIL